MGVNYEIGKQHFFPFNSPDYSYKIKGSKFLINYPLKNSGAFSYELQLEPGIYVAQHKLLNEFYVQPKDKLSFFVLGSIGPMYGNTETERLATGFAFSDIVAFGIAYKVGKTVFEVKPGLRHNSNANIRLPNSGHNSTTIDFGISVFL